MLVMVLGFVFVLARYGILCLRWFWFLCIRFVCGLRLPRQMVFACCGGLRWCFGVSLGFVVPGWLIACCLGGFDMI